MEPDTKLDDLPEICIFAILSFTTPRDACRLATLCKLFRSAVCSDLFWDNWLPPHYQQILPTALSPIHFSCKKELYFHLCHGNPIDGGTKMFWLDRSTAKPCYMLSVRELSIVGDDDEGYWRWLYHTSISSSSRLGEVWLRPFGWLELRGKLDCRLLSVNTEYQISFLIHPESYALMRNVVPITFGVKTPEGDEDEKECGQIAKRDDGWLEIIAGEFMSKANLGFEGAGPYVEFWMERGPWRKELLLGGVIFKPKSVWKQEFAIAG